MFKITITNKKDNTRQWGSTFETMEALNTWLSKQQQKEGRRLSREIRADQEAFDENDVISERFEEGPVIEEQPTEIRFVTLQDEAEYATEDITDYHNQQITNKTSLRFLQETDWKVLRHRDQIDLGSATSMTEQEFQELLQQRQTARESINWVA